MSPTPLNSITLKRASGVAGILALLLAVVFALPSAADDRDLFQAAAESPYVMMLLDTSGSMNTQLDGSRAIGDQATPGARFYQAKAAVYDVVRGLDDRIRLGLAHFPQPGSEADRKHYLYTRATGQANPGWWDALQWPLETDNVAFGRWVVNGDDSNYGWCNNTTNVRNRLNAFPKLDHDGTVETTIYTNNVNGNGQRLRVRFTALPANTLGTNTFDLTINVTAINSDCTFATGGAARNQTATITMVPSFTDDADPQANKPFIDAAGNQVAFDYFGRYNHDGVGTILDWTRFADCGESVLWEPNENGATGTNSSEGQFAYPTQADPFLRDATNRSFERGDVIPWDWRGFPQPFPTAGFEHSSKNEILYRLAPNTRPDPMTGLPTEAYVVTATDVANGTYPGFNAGDAIPILRSAYYFEQQPVAGTLPPSCSLRQRASDLHRHLYAARRHDGRHCRLVRRLGALRLERYDRRPRFPVPREVRHPPFGRSRDLRRQPRNRRGRIAHAGNPHLRGWLRYRRHRRLAPGDRQQWRHRLNQYRWAGTRHDRTGIPGAGLQRLQRLRHQWQTSSASTFASDTTPPQSPGLHPPPPTGSSWLKPRPSWSSLSKGSFPRCNPVRRASPPPRSPLHRSSPKSRSF